MPTARRTASVIACLLVATSLTSPAAAEPTQETSIGPVHHVVVDALVVRPAGLVATGVLGGVFWLIGAPVFAVTGDMEWWNDVCWKEPVRQYIERPLGRF